MATKTKTKTAAETPATRGVVPSKFRERYAEHGGSCGDELAGLLAERTRTADGKVDFAKLKAFAEANDIWQDSYSKLNVGMMCMNVSNRAPSSSGTAPRSSGPPRARPVALAREREPWRRDSPASLRSQLAPRDGGQAL